MNGKFYYIIKYKHTFLQSQELLFDSPHEPVVDVQPNILALVVLRDGNAAATGLQLVHLEDSEGVDLHLETGVDHTSDFVLPGKNNNIFYSIN